MSVEIGVVISVFTLIVGILGLLVSYLAYQNKKNKNTKTDTKEDAQLKAGVDYISRGVDDIKIDLKANEKHINAVAERVTRVEESSKQAHKRIDNMKEDS